jgi:two-component system, NtrC family, sensor kinase
VKAPFPAKHITNPFPMPWMLWATLVLALAAIFGFNLILVRHEAQARMEDLLEEQVRDAQTLAAMLEEQMRVRPSLDLPALGRDLQPLDRPGDKRLFLQPPGAAWQDLQGRPVPLDLASRDQVVGQDLSLHLNMPVRRTALGRGTFRDGQGRIWNLAVVGAARRERDRERQAAWRLVLSILVTSSFLLAIFRWAFLAQRKELEYAREVEIREMGRRKDQVLNQMGRAATMLTLASGVAHEISTPLGVISGRATQLATRLKEDEGGLRLARAILEEGDRISRTVRRFLDLARGGPIAPGLLQIHALMNTVRALVGHRFELADVALDLRIPENLPRLQGDARLLEHLFVNLLLNACDASDPGARVSFRACPQETGVTLEVQDQGAGIPEDQVERIMEPFFTTKAKGEGTGLGLAIAREIVRMHRGDLTFQAAQPRGTLAIVRLPTA